MRGAILAARETGIVHVSTSAELHPENPSQTPSGQPHPAVLAPTPERVRAVERLAEQAREHDGAAPFSEQTLVQLRRAARDETERILLVIAEEDGQALAAAVATAPDPQDEELSLIHI